MSLENCRCEMKPFGISAYTTCAFLMPCMYCDLTRSHKVIFVHTLMLSYFIEIFLPYWKQVISPKLLSPFILISGGNDLTIPRNIDTRYLPLPGFNDAHPGWSKNHSSSSRTTTEAISHHHFFYQLINASYLIHWYAENRDVYHEKLSSLPTGLSYAAQRYPDNLDDVHLIQSLLVYDNQGKKKTEYDNLTQRTLKIFVTDRLHDDTNPQWNERRYVRTLCDMTIFCETPEDRENVEHLPYITSVLTYPLLLCVHGGGIDPSPKVWEAILIGTIPIIRSSYVIDAYRQLPVIIIDEWNQVLFDNETVTLYKSGFKKEINQFYATRLQQWIRQLTPYYEPGLLRNETIRVSGFPPSNYPSKFYYLFHFILLVEITNKILV
jgi:hypothetical protein